jgi:predicted RNA-binding protein with RPS1 domain
MPCCCDISGQLPSLKEAVRARARSFLNAFLFFLSFAAQAIKPYGAFVEINGISGLLHISQISYDRIDNLETVLSVNSVIKCMIIDHDKVNGRIALSTKTLEPEPGDMIKDPKKVFDLAEQTAAKYHERMEAERQAREEAAKDIVMGLGDLDASFSSSSDLDEVRHPRTLPTPTHSSNSPSRFLACAALQILNPAA